jgi:hypothetical protein
MQFKQRKKVDLPLPEGPITQMTSPRQMSVVIPFKTSKDANDLDKDSV